MTELVTGSISRHTRHVAVRQLRRYGLRTLLAILSVSLIAASGLPAQDTLPQKKPGGVTKVAKDISKASKKAGRDTKAELKRAGSKAHHVAQDAGNGTKKALKDVTGIKAPQKENPGGLNKIARDISKTGKKAARDTRDEKNRVKSKAHAAATKTGKKLKGDSVPPI